jgi:hypothetical protein
MRLPAMRKPVNRTRSPLAPSAGEGVIPSTGRCQGCYDGVTAPYDCDADGAKGVVNGLWTSYNCTGDAFYLNTFGCAGHRLVLITPDATGTYPCSS